MEARRLFREEEPAARLLLSNVAELTGKGLPLSECSEALRSLYVDAQTPRPDDPPLPFYYKR